MSYYTSVIKDSPLGFWKLDESSGSIAYDYSGCGNHGSYNNFVSETIFPLVANGVSGTTITNTSYLELPIYKNYYGSSATESFGTKYTSDNDFSLEVWVYPKNVSGPVPLLGGSQGVGIFWDNGNVMFSLSTESVDYTVPNPNKSLHIVGVYKKNSISLYIDGILVRSKKLNNFKFLNTELDLQIGPCSSGESFVVDAPAVYRYSLNDIQIKSHYLKSTSVSDTQIASLNGGYIFRSTEKHQSETDKFIYPASKGWEYMLGDSLEYDEIENSIYLSSSKTFGSFIEVIGLSIRKNYISSKIEWLAGEGVEVFVSTDETNWTQCENGSSLPDLNNKKIIYIKVEFSSTNASIYVPELYYLNIFFYTEKKLYSHNGIGYIQAAENQDIDISNKEYHVLSRAKGDGIKCKSSGFKVNIEEDILDVEFIFTPTALGSGYLLYNNTESTEYSLYWASGGAITKSGISSIYINGQDVSEATNISSYLNISEPNHIFIKLSGGCSGDIWFNLKNYNGTISGTLPDNVYKNVTIYNNNDADPETNYQLYLGNNSIVVEDSDISVDELDVFTYSPDWVTILKA